MKISFGAAVCLFVFAVPRLLGEASVPRISPSEAAERVASGEAVLVDVREAHEWAEGVAEPAHLLALSDLRGEREHWKAFLENLPEGREVILYCRTGNRSGIAGEILADEGVPVLNSGGLREWKSAGLPVRIPTASKGEFSKEEERKDG